jgi:hypothetical protein
MRRGMGADRKAVACEDGDFVGLVSAHSIVTHGGGIHPQVPSELPDHFVAAARHPVA